MNVEFAAGDPTGVKERTQHPPILDIYSLGVDIVDSARAEILGDVKVVMYKTISHICERKRSDAYRGSCVRTGPETDMIYFCAVALFPCLLA